MAISRRPEIPVMSDELGNARVCGTSIDLRNLLTLMAQKRKEQFPDLDPTRDYPWWCKLASRHLKKLSGSVSLGAVSALGISRCFGCRPELELANRRRVTARCSNATVRVDDVQLYQTRLTGQKKKRRCRTRRSLLIFVRRGICNSSSCRARDRHSAYHRARTSKRIETYSELACEVSHDDMMPGMMWAMGFIWLLVIIFLILGAAALVKYPFSGRKGDRQ